MDDENTTAARSMSRFQCSAARRRAAVKTASGRLKVAEWLKLMENQTARSGDHNSDMASYDFGWLRTELGISELRR